MSDVVLVGDLHCGLRGANPIFEKELEHFLYEVLLPDLRARKPLVAIFLGDLFDDRRALNLRSIALIKKFLDELDELDIICFFILGNHDIHYRDRLAPNSVEPLLREYRNLKVVAQPEEIQVEGEKFLLVPWICKENEKEVLEAIDASDADYLCGHFEILGFDQQPGVPSTHGHVPGFFSNFLKVFSGHYHCASNRDNIYYIGTPYQMTRADDGLTKSYVRFDHKRNEIVDRVVNPSKLFETVRLKGDKIDGWDYREWMTVWLDEVSLQDKIVTLICDSSSDDAIEWIVKKIEAESAYDIKVVDNRISLGDIDSTIENIQTADTMTIIRECVDNDPDLEGFDRELIKKMLTAVYEEALGGNPAEI